MQAIRRRIYIFAAFTGAGILTGAGFFAVGAANIQAHIRLASIVLASAISAGLWIHEYRKLKTARLIVENEILHFLTAIISYHSSEGAEPEDIENTEVFVSYFGILLGSKIIKFNQDGIRLRAVEIGEDFISFTYGREKQMLNIRLLRPSLDPMTLDRIAEKIRYETGIKPTLRS